MPSKLVICGHNALDLATMTVNPSSTTYVNPGQPVSNLQIPSRGRVWRTKLCDVSQEVKFTWGGTGYYLSFLCLMRHNLSTDATWRIQLYTTADWTGTEHYDSGTVAAYEGLTLGELDWGIDQLGASVFDGYLGQKWSVHYIPPADLGTATLSGKITITDISNANGYIEASRLFAGNGTELVYNPSALEFAWEEDSKQLRSDGGSLRSDGTNAFRRLNLTIDNLDTTQRAALANTLRFAGRRKDLFISVFPQEGGQKESDYTLICRNVGQMPSMNEIAGKAEYSMRLSLEES